MDDLNDVRTLRFGQRLGVGAWRTLMRVATTVASLRRFSPPGAFSREIYGSHARERLEFIEPRDTVPARAPVVFVHGGGWICGNKEMYTRDLLFLVEAGYPVFNVEYPLAPERPHPHMLRSLLSALAWIRQQHPEHDAVHLMGDSAGGNLALMLGILSANPEHMGPLGLDAPLVLPRPRSLTSIYGILDRLSWIEQGAAGAALMLECYAGPSALEPEVEPHLAVTPMDLDFESLPPTFIAVGGEDALAKSSRICSESMRQRFDEIEHRVYPGEDHGFFNRASRPASQALRRDILAFLEEH